MIGISLRLGVGARMQRRRPESVVIASAGLVIAGTSVAVATISGSVPPAPAAVAGIIITGSGNAGSAITGTIQ